MVHQGDIRLAFSDAADEEHEEYSVVVRERGEWVDCGQLIVSEEHREALIDALEQKGITFFTQEDADA